MPISYEEALETLKAMFGHQGYTATQLDAVLRHHGGHMEHTVETILVHGEGLPDALIQNLPNIPPGGPGSGGGGGGGGGGEGAAPGGGAGSEGGGGHTIDADEELARQLASEDQEIQGGGDGVGLAAGRGVNFHPGRRRAPAPAPPAPPAARSTPTPPPPPPQKKGRGTSTNLPEDFLRIPGRKYPNAATGASPSGGVPVAGGAGMTDEQLARMLQDELFQEELRNNPEFSHLAGRRNPRADASRQQQTARSNAWGGGGAGGGNEFFENLTKMGDTAKRRFQELAATWGDNGNRGGGSGGSGGSGGMHMGFGRASGGGPAAERRGLLDEDEEELTFQVDGGGHSVELQDIGEGNGSKKKD